MRYLKFSLLFICVPFFSFCQNRPYEIFGTINGDYNSKMYLFFEGNFRQRDSLSSEIKNGRFYFKGSVPMPILARLHMDQQSYIQDIYLDTSKIYVSCTTSMNRYNNGQDTLNMLSVVSVKGSATNKLKSDFEAWMRQLIDSKMPDEEKRQTFHQKLSTFIHQHPRSKLSLYLLGKASLLTYSQVKELSTFIDTSLNKSFETKSVADLLNQLDKTQNRAIGAAFHEFVLPDSNGRQTDSKLFRGKYSLVVLWAAWCKPCRAEHPELNVLYKKYNSKGLEMIGLSLDKDTQKWKQAVVKDSLQWVQVIDTTAFEGEIAKYYGIDAIPANFLLDKEGKIIGAGLTLKEIEARLKQLL